MEQVKKSGIDSTEMDSDDIKVPDQIIYHLQQNSLMILKYQNCSKWSCWHEIYFICFVTYEQHSIAEGVNNSCKDHEVDFLNEVCS